MQILLQFDKVLLPLQIHKSLCMHFSMCWSIAPSVHYHTGSMLCVTFIDLQNSVNAFDVYCAHWSECRINLSLIDGCDSNAFFSVRIARSLLNGSICYCYTGDYTAVIKIQNRAVISYLMFFLKQISEIGTPFLIWFFNSKILMQFVCKHLMWFSMFVPCFFRTHGRKQSHFRVHIFMNGCGTVMISSVCQIKRHALVSIHTLGFMINIPDLCLYLWFLSIINRLPVFTVVIISVRTDANPPK